MRKLSGRFQGAGPSEILTLNGHTTDQKEIANVLAQTFSANSDDLDLTEAEIDVRNQLHQLNIVPNDYEINDLNDDFAPWELNSALNKVKGKSTGNDQISYSMLKKLPPPERNELLSLYNRIYAAGHFPVQWKNAVVVPIPKPGKDPLQPSSYRPISLLSCLGKVMEKMVAERLMWWLEFNELIPNNQSGFRKARSTTDNLALLQHYTVRALNAREHVTWVSFDLEKAYERVWRINIINQLKMWGLRGRILKYLEDFLSSRSFTVAVGNTFSESQCQQNGVPTGSVLSVPLFLIAIASVSHSLSMISVEHLLYADDLIIFAKSKKGGKLQNIIQNALETLGTWSREFGFKFSAEKTKFIHFCRLEGCEPPRHSLYGIPIEPTTVLRVLGVLFDEKLNFRKHLQELKSSCLKRLRIIRILSSTKWGSDRRQLLHIAQALLGGKCDYASQVFGTASKTTLSTINGVFNTAIRLATGAFKSSPTISVLAEANVPSLEERRSLQLVRWANKIRYEPKHILHREFRSVEGRRGGRRRLVSVVDMAREALSRLELPEFSRQLNQVCPFPPWRFNPECLDISLAQLRKEITPSKTYRILFQEKLSHLGGYSCYYTDGSKQESGTGFGVFSGDAGLSCSVSTSGLVSIFSAEAKAVHHALSVASPHQGRTAILTDSLSVVQALGGSDNHHPTITNIKMLVYSNPHDTRIVWIPGHCGIAGNEKADELAGDAASKRTVEDISVPLVDLQRRCKEKWISRRGAAWANLSEENKLRSICDDPQKLPHPVLNRRLQTILTRLRVGHSRLTHSYRMVGAQPPICDFCSDEDVRVVVSVQHVLEDCAVYRNERSEVGGAKREYRECGANAKAVSSAYGRPDAARFPTTTTTTIVQI
ncbi:uncharacterized protein LOC129794534 [Lutzomyia longipalpis]|uniref:uncharacterized protein LOC129794534 n=1 Tax=Lutzomyia longipalpis TaxID=7200 RepID=UPI002483F9BA|nr:uncharacterized protein LOC129794534 [Lutzomyia longipalpis]